jgi:hypothetical protein
MTDARIVVDPSTLRPGRLGPATGAICLSLGQSSFPTAGWNDFVVVVLGWWAEAALQLMRGASDRADVNFIDGPYLVGLWVRSPGEWEVSLFEAGHENPPCGRALVSPACLVDSIVMAAEALLAACRERNCWSAEADQLERLQASLRAEVAAHRN